MTDFTERDELIHPAGSEDAWREAYYFDFFDPASRLSGFAYAGAHPNQQLGDMVFALWREDVLLAQFKRWDFHIPKEIGEDRFSFSPFCFRPLEPFTTCEFFYDDGHARVDLTFHAIHPPYNWGVSHGTLAKTNSHHYEQQGRYTGHVRVGGQSWEIQGLGARDHAWGWGARAGIRRWMWASAQFPREFCFNTFQVTLADGRDILYGYVYRGSENVLLRRSNLHAEYAMKGKAPAVFGLELETHSGEVVTASGHILNAFNTSFQERNKTGYHFFCATEYQCEGQVGYGQANFHWRGEPDRPYDWGVTQEE